MATSNYLKLFVLSLFASSAMCSESAAHVPDVSASALPKVMKLQRKSVTLPKSAERPGKQKNFYFAKIAVGKPAQEFDVSFDLGGGTTVLPSVTCVDKACLERRRYNEWLSETAEDIQANGQLVNQREPKTLLRRRDQGFLDLDSIDVGFGKVSGTFVRDEVCVSGESDTELQNEPRCFPLALLAASTMSDMPFLTEPYDGTVGLGLKGMSITKEFNFLAAFQHGHYMSTMTRNSFGLHIGTEEDGGEVTLGGYDVNRLTHPLKWAKVADPDAGPWQVAVSAIRIGNTTLDMCRDRVCRAAFDYSSSLLGVPASMVDGLQNALAKFSPPEGFGDGCQILSMPDISLELGNDITITLPPEDYVSDSGTRKSLISKPSCEPFVAHQHASENLDSLRQDSSDVFVLGESVLRRYYTFYDADSLQVGFSLAAPALSTGGKKNIETLKTNEKKAASKSETATIFLVQVKIMKSKTLSLDGDIL